VIKELEDLPGVGDVSAEKLRKAGYDIEKIAASSPHELDEIADIGGGNREAHHFRGARLA